MGRSPNEALANSELAGMHLTEEMRRDGYKMNMDKRESLVCFVGAGAQSTQKEVFVRRSSPLLKPMQNFRVLGGLLNYAGSVAAKIGMRT